MEPFWSQRNALLQAITKQTIAYHSEVHIQGPCKLPERQPLSIHHYSQFPTYGQDTPPVFPPTLSLLPLVSPLHPDMKLKYGSHYYLHVLFRRTIQHTWFTCNSTRWIVVAFSVIKICAVCKSVFWSRAFQRNYLHWLQIAIFEVVATCICVEEENTNLQVICMLANC